MSALAPGYCPDTLMVGGAISGYCAIGSEQARKFVYLIDQDNVARLRYVTLGQLVDDLRVIKNGLSAGDRVVVNGLMRVRQGQKVTPEERPASPQASVPARATAGKTD